MAASSVKELGMFRQVLVVVAIAVTCGSPARAEAKQDKWTSVGLCGGGGLYNPVVSPHDPRLMMVESDMGGRYISHDRGRTWKMIHHKQIGSAVRGAAAVSSDQARHHLRPERLRGRCDPRQQGQWQDVATLA